jgi:hypothetical protein
MALPGLQVAAEAAPVLIAQLRRHEHGERLPQEFRHAVAEEALGGRVGKADGAGRINDEDGIRGRLRHDAKAFFTRPQGLVRLPAFGDFRLQRRRPLLDPPVELSIQRAQRRFGLLPLGHLALQGAVGRFQLGRAGECQGFGHQWDQQRRRGQRHASGHHFDEAFQPIDGLPEGPNPHQMGGATGEDEGPEEPEHPVEG